MSDELVKRISEKYVWPLDTEQAYGVYLGSDNLTAYRIVKAVTPALRDDRLFFARNAVESAIREALEEIAKKFDRMSARDEYNQAGIPAFARAARIIREQAKAPAETEGTK